MRDLAGVLMAYGEDGGSVPAITARGRDWPSVRQFNVFLENRVGVLLDVVRLFENTDLKIVALSVVDLADCAIVRMVISEPDRAMEIFQNASVPVTQSDLLVVQLPEGDKPLQQIFKALLPAEINIDYAYSLLVGSNLRPCIALHVDDHETASRILASKSFTVISENDLNE